MPAKDKHHDSFINAICKAGWRIILEQVPLILGERRLWIDLKAVNDETAVIILIEIKSFDNMPSPVEYLSAALGKYLLYQSILNELEDKTPLYLAVPEDAYSGILDEEIGQLLLNQVKAKLIVFDPDLEEIKKWIH